MTMRPGDSPARTPGAPSEARGSAGAERALSREVLSAVRRRDPAALSQLYEAHFDRVFALAFRLLGERAAAEDTTQEVFLKVYRAAHRLDPDRDPGPWLTTITYNVCRDHWRSRSHRMSRDSTSVDEHPGLLEALTGGEPSGEERLIDDERDRLVQKAINRLPMDLRAVVVLHEYHGLNHLEIAEVVKASHAAVRKRYSRALEQLGTMLKDVLE
jgi:RNA polymerase sigma-70 factor (ECF subfamily)